MTLGFVPIMGAGLPGAESDDGLAGVDAMIADQVAKSKPRPRITKTMVEAGVAALIALDNGSNHKELAQAIYTAMWDVRAA